MERFLKNFRLPANKKRKTDEDCQAASKNMRLSAECRHFSQIGRQNLRGYFKIAQNKSRKCTVQIVIVHLECTANSHVGMINAKVVLLCREARTLNGIP